MVDLLSDGRARRSGLGAGYRVPEFELVRRRHRPALRLTDQRVRELRALSGRGPGDAGARPTADADLGWGTRARRAPGRAGRLGEGLLSATAAALGAVRGGAARGWPRSTRSGRMAGSFQGFVTDDPERDWPVVSRHLAYQLDSYRRYMVEGTDAPVPRSRWIPERVRAPATPTCRSHRSSTELPTTWRRSCGRGPPARRWRPCSSGCRSVRCPRTLCAAARADALYAARSVARRPRSSARSGPETGPGRERVRAARVCRRANCRRRPTAGAR